MGIQGRCYCAEIKRCESDQAALEEAEVVLTTLKSVIADTVGSLKKLKSSTQEACNIDMADFDPVAFNQKARDSTQAALASIKERKTAVRTKLKSYKERDARYHRSVEREHRRVFS
jgi:hypothetical protein